MKNCKFRNQFEPHERCFCCSGSGVKTVYAGHYDDDGSFDLVKNGKVNIYQEIQSHAESVDIHVILKRYENGDISALNQAKGSFADFTGMPKNYAEMLNYLIDRKAEFMAMPVDIRNQFGNDFNQYMATAGTNEWLDKMGVFKAFDEAMAKVEKPVDNPVKDGE